MRKHRMVGFTAALMLGASLAWAAPLDVNSAPAGDLATLDGVSEEVASAVVREREENGPFGTVEDLKRVPGMSADVLARIKSRITFGEGGGGGAKAAPSSKQDAEVQRILKKFAREPTAREVQDAALRYTRLNPDIIDSWRVRTRLAGAAPQFKVTAGYVPQRDYLWIQTNGSLDIIPPPSGTTNVTRRDTLQNQGTLAATATWDLDRLIYDPQEARVTREALRISKQMDGVLDDVTRRYFERRRMQVELELAPPSDVGERLRKEIRMQELTADLDGISGGYFSAELKKRSGAR
jgi:competence protein ComEA